MTGKGVFRHAPPKLKVLYLFKLKEHLAYVEDINNTIVTFFNIVIKCVRTL